jgi:hypothetical protein
MFRNWRHTCSVWIAWHCSMAFPLLWWGIHYLSPLSFPNVRGNGEGRHVWNCRYDCCLLLHLLGPSVPSLPKSLGVQKLRCRHYKKWSSIGRGYSHDYLSPSLCTWIALTSAPLELQCSLELMTPSRRCHPASFLWLRILQMPDSRCLVVINRREVATALVKLHWNFF